MDSFKIFADEATFVDLQEICCQEEQRKEAKAIVLCCLFNCLSFSLYISTSTFFGSNNVNTNFSLSFFFLPNYTKDFELLFLSLSLSFAQSNNATITTARYSVYQQKIILAQLRALHRRLRHLRQNETARNVERRVK